MKKLLSLFLILLLLLPASGYADVLTDGWQTASDDELTAAVEEITRELKTRKATRETEIKEDPEADCIVTAVGVGSSTKKLSYEVVETGLYYWTKANGSVECFAFVAVKNTDKKAIYLGNCTMDFEDKQGNLLESRNRVSSCPDVIDPGEIGYFYVSSVNGGGFNAETDLSNGCNMTAQFSLSAARETVEPFELMDLELTTYKYFSTDCPMIIGRIRNNGEEDVQSSYINYLFRDNDGKVIWISGTNVSGLYAGAKVGLELKEIFGPPYLTMDNIGSFEVIAKPYYHQFN